MPPSSHPERAAERAPADPVAPAATPGEPRSLRLEDWLTVLVMGALALITFVNVLVLYFTNSSFAWTEELSVFLMIVLALVAGSAAVARDRHIRIEFFCASGSALRRRRLAQDLSQEALARRADVSMRFVSLLELGRHMPTINTMQKLAKGLGVPLSDLVREAEAEPAKE